MFKFLHEDNELKTNSVKTYYKHVFYILMACSVLVFFILAYVTGGTSFKGLFMSDTSDTFMDHFNSVIYNKIDPYENGVVYPPLATYTYGSLLKLIPEDVFNSLVSDPTVLAQPRDVKLTQGFVFQFILFMVVIFLCFMATMYLCKKGRNYEKLLCTVLLLLSAPMLYAIERGNNIIIPLIFSLIFINYYDSKNKVIKEIALISLAIAVAFKLYPIAFGVLLFRNKQFKELVRTGIYCVILVILPFFLFYNGMESLNHFLDSISRFDGKRTTAANIKGQLSFNSMFHYIVGFFGLDVENVGESANLFKNIVTVICIAFTFVARANWKAVALCACFMCGYQGSSPKYLLIFFFVPIIMMLDDEKKNSVANYISVVLMVLVIAPIIWPDPNTGGWSVYMTGKISSFAMLALALTIVVDTIVSYIITFTKFIKNKKEPVALDSSVLSEDGGAVNA